MDSNLITLEADTQNANTVKEIVLSRLLSDKAITEEQARIYSENWQVLVIKKGWFTRWLEAFKRGKADEYQYKFVKFED